VCVWWLGGLGRRRTRPMWDETMISRSICKTTSAVDDADAPPARSRVPVGRFPAAASVRAPADWAYFIIIYYTLYGAAVVRIYYNMGKEIFLFLNEPAGYQHAPRNRVAQPVPVRRFGHHSFWTSVSRASPSPLLLQWGRPWTQKDDRVSWGLVVGLP